MPLPLIPILMGAGLLAQGYGLYQQHKAGDKQQDYLEEQEKYNKQLREEQKRERMREALARAIGANTQFKPYEAPDAPKAPDLSGYATRAGLAGLGSTALSDILAHPEWFKKVPGALPSDIANMGSWDAPGGYNA